MTNMSSGKLIKGSEIVNCKDVDIVALIKYNYHIISKPLHGLIQDLNLGGHMNVSSRSKMPKDRSFV